MLLDDNMGEPARFGSRRATTMNTHRAALALVAVFCGLPAHAEPEAEWYPRTTCIAPFTPAESEFSATLLKETVLRDLIERPLTRSAKELEKVCAVLGKAWRAQKQPTFIAIIETGRFHINADMDIVEDQNRLRIGMYQQGADGHYRLVAKTSEPVALGEGEAVSSLDFARYQMTPTTYAFGVRSLRHFILPGGGGDNKYLQAFGVQGKTIRTILSSTLIKSSHERNGEMVGEGMFDKVFAGDEAGATISVLKSRTDGVFDWKIQLGRVSRVMKWTGDDYESLSPVEDVNSP
jgi:hypothetical protein